MDGPRDYHTKQIKSERERQIPYDITYVWNLQNRLTDIENRLVFAEGEEGGRGMD